MKIGAVVAAAGMSSQTGSFKPMMKIGSTTIIKRIIAAFKEAGIQKIVVVTGNNAEKLEKHISHMGVVFARNNEFETTDMYDSILKGLKYFDRTYDYIFLTPADTPLISQQVIEKLLNTSAEISCPSYKGKLGHPVLISNSQIQELLNFKGKEGLYDLIKKSSSVNKIPVNDADILFQLHTEHDYEELKTRQREIIKSKELCANMQLRLSKEEVFFGPGTAEFLMLVESTGSMKTACSHMHMSYSKAWKMVNLAEEQLGFSILKRQAGGMEGGSSELTMEGRDFIYSFINFQKEACVEVEKLFNKYFMKFKNNYR